MLCYVCVCPPSQSCPTLSDPVACTLPGSSVHGILQARILEWGAMPSSRGSSDPGMEPASLTCQVGSLPLAPPKPCYVYFTTIEKNHLYQTLNHHIHIS